MSIVTEQPSEINGKTRVSLPIAFDPKLPRMKCDAGCGECCGIVSCSKREADVIAEYIAANGITPIRQGSTCPFLHGGNCAIYPVRPFICRLFGHSPKLVCSRGYNVNVTPRREERIMRDYFATGAEPVYFLHATVYSEVEILGLFVEETKADVRTQP